MKNRCLLASVFAVALAMMGTVANATPVQFGTGNYYELITDGANWETARANANAMTYLGLPGHLVTITSADENKFVATQLGVFGRAWTAGTDSAVEGDFRWSDGPEVGQLYWTGGLGGSAVGFAAYPVGEPNNQGGTEHHMEIFYFGGDWNDQEASDVISYIVEYEAVPEPATAALGALASIGFLSARRRRSS